MKNLHWKMSAILFLFATGAWAEGTLTLEDYVNQVKAMGPSYLQGITNWKTNDLARILIGKHWSASLGLSGGGSGSYNDSDYNYVYVNGINTNPGSYHLNFAPNSRAKAKGN